MNNKKYQNNYRIALRKYFMAVCALIFITLTAFTCGDDDYYGACTCETYQENVVFDSVRTQRKDGSVWVSGLNELWTESMVEDFFTDKEDGVYFIHITADLGKVQYSEDYPYPQTDKTCMPIKDIVLQRYITTRQQEDYNENFFVGTWVEADEDTLNGADTLIFKYSHYVDNRNGEFNGAVYTCLEDNTLRFDYYLDKKSYDFKYDSAKVTDHINKVGSELIFYNYGTAEKGIKPQKKFIKISGSYSLFDK